VPVDEQNELVMWFGCVPVHTALLKALAAARSEVDDVQVQK